MLRTNVLALSLAFILMACKSPDPALVPDGGPVDASVGDLGASDVDASGGDNDASTDASLIGFSDAAMTLPSVTGTVEDGTGAPVAGRAITLVDGAGTQSQTKSAADGSFGFTNVVTPYDIVVAGVGTQPTARGILGIAASTLKLGATSNPPTPSGSEVTVDAYLPGCLMSGCTFMLDAAAPDDATPTLPGYPFDPPRGWAPPTPPQLPETNTDVGIYWSGSGTATANLYVVSFDGSGTLSGYSVTPIAGFPTFPNNNPEFIPTVTAAPLTAVTAPPVALTVTMSQFQAAAPNPTLSLVETFPHLTDPITAASSSSSLAFSAAYDGPAGTTAKFVASYTNAVGSASETAYAEMPAVAHTAIALTRPPSITSPAAGATLTGGESFTWDSYGAEPLTCLDIDSIAQPSTLSVCLSGTSVSLARIEALAGQLSSGTYSLTVNEYRPGAEDIDTLIENYDLPGPDFNRSSSAPVQVTRAP
jgi:hypothetical protein